MEEAIKKAMEGGYRPSFLRPLDWSYVISQLKNKLDTDTEGFIARIFLDPLFWQALGKACGWTEICNNPDHGFIDAFGNGGSGDVGRLGCPVCGHNEDHVVEKTRYEWRKKALRFHEINLTEGWSKAEAYLSELVK